MPAYLDAMGEYNTHTALKGCGIKTGLKLQKLHPQVKVTLKSAKSGVLHAAYRQKRFVKSPISLLLLQLKLWNVIIETFISRKIDEHPLMHWKPKRDSR